MGNELYFEINTSASLNILALLSGVNITVQS